MTAAPIAFVHPLRVRRFRALNLLAAIAWIATSTMLVVEHPAQTPWALGVWIASGAWFIVSGLVRTLMPRADRASEEPASH